MRLAVLAATMGLLAATPALADACKAPTDPAGFPAWLDGIRTEAGAAGISARGLSALDGLTWDQETISHDRGQKVFKQTFEEFSGRMVNDYRIKKGGKLIKQYAADFAKIEEQYGVPAPVITAIWGLETDFGAFLGKFQTIRSLATLAYDCRRSDRFHAELLDALRIVDRGDMVASAMHGAWAGEIGQTQFMPSSYVKYAVDFDGDGHSDLVNSVPDVLASTAKYLAESGWQRGAGWAPGEPNFAAIQVWNKSDIYSRTIALLATRLAGN